MNVQWEYLHFEFVGEFTKQLNELGCDGWELVVAEFTRQPLDELQHMRGIMKRPFTVTLVYDPDAAQAAVSR